MPDFMSGAMFHAILAWPTNNETHRFHRASNTMIAEVVRRTRRASPEMIDEFVRDWPQHDWTSILAASTKRRIVTAGINRRLGQRMVAAKMGISLIYEDLFRKPQQLPPSISRLSIDQLAAFVAGEAHINDAENVEKLIWRPSLPIIHLAIAAEIVLLVQPGDEANLGRDLQDYEFNRGVILLARLIEPIVVAHKKINISAGRRNAPLQIEYLPVATLKPMSGAARKHPPSQIKSLCKSIAAFGFNVPILVDSEGRIVGGHARVTAAVRLGLSEVPAIRIQHLTEPQIKAFMLADNRLAELARWDDQALGVVLLELSTLDLDFDLDATGFAMAEIDLRIEGLAERPDDAADIAVAVGPSITQPGDIWLLARHRLLCGNALEAAYWSVVMADDQAALVVTDPPYRVTGKGR